MGEIFRFLHLLFDIELAKRIIKHYVPEAMKPDASWISPLVRVEEGYVGAADLLKPLIFATLPANDTELVKYLVDGNHTLTRAIREGVNSVNVVELTVLDSLKILKSRKDIRDSIKASARKMGYL